LPDEVELDDKQTNELQKRRKKEAKDALKIRKKELKLERERVRAVEETAPSVETDLGEPEHSPTASRGISWKGVAVLTTILVLLVAVSFVISFIHPFLGGALLTVGGFLLGIARKDVRRVLGLE
jgi:Flp pilus assembly protein TadB